MTTPGLLHDHETPLGWGLLEADGTDIIVEKCVPTRFSGVETLRWLERIAKAATHQSVKLLHERRERYPHDE
jgi:hypothetical protein